MDTLTPAELKEINRLSRPVGGFWKFAAGMVFLVFLAVGSYVSYRIYALDQQRQATDQLTEALQSTERAVAVRRAADSYGGSTPQATLRLFIAALDRDDYKLASRYFVIGFQSDELLALERTPPADLARKLAQLRQALAAPGSYSATGDRYRIDRPIPIGFLRYPSQIWKLSEL
ncbi:MAG: hypothetical protein HY978_03980 [Candidatus Liptonbacteria bacterium]|nr:hypothetical protein [Candidatus Liptonbacteria bacterium]